MRTTVWAGTLRLAVALLVGICVVVIFKFDTRLSPLQPQTAPFDRAEDNLGISKNESQPLPEPPEDTKELRRRVFGTLADRNVWRGALQLAKSLKSVQSSAPLVVFTLDVLHDAIVDAFHAVGAQVRQIPRTPVPPTVIILQPSWAIAWNKLYLLTLEKDFDRIVFLDADTMLLQNVDELLQMEGWAAAPGQCKKCEISYGFNGGVFGFRPNITVYEELMQLASQKNPTNWHQSEQQLIGTYLARRSSSVIWISPAYNWMATGCDCLSKDQWSTIKILHWYCSGPNERPWEQSLEYWKTQHSCIASLNAQWHTNVLLATTGFNITDAELTRPS